MSPETNLEYQKQFVFTIFLVIISAWFAESFTCPGQFGSYPDEYACENYWTCVFGKPEAQKCMHGLMYDDSLQNCAWPNPYTCKMQHGKAIRKSSKNSADSKTDAANSVADESRQSTNTRNNHHRNRDNYSPSPPQGEAVAEQPPPANAEWSWSHGRTLAPQTLATTTNEPPYQPLHSDGLPPIEWIPPRNRHTSSTVYPTSAEQQQLPTTARFAIPNEQQQQQPIDGGYLVENQPPPPPPPPAYRPSFDEQQQNDNRPLNDASLPPPPPEPATELQQPRRKMTPQRRQLFDPQQLAYISAAAARYTAEQQQAEQQELQQQQEQTTAATLPPTTSTTTSNYYSHPAVTVVPVGTSPPSCDPRQCVLPDCYCDSARIPGGFDRKDTPQFVLVTFDDGVSELNYELYTRIFNRKNPNGCPIRGTMFLSHEWTDYGMVQNLYSMGHEIASHTISHGNGGSYSKEKWYDEIVGLREIAAKFALVNESDVIGFRAPFLETGTDVMYQVLYENGFTYESSIPSNSRDPPMWPYTMEYKFPHVCWISPCPKGSYPGLWEIPMTHLMDDANRPCAMYDACTWPATSDGVTEQLFKNFLQHYRTNRAPFPLFAHSNWQQTDHTHRNGFSVFLDTILEAPDVWVVTVAQMLEWVKNPVPLSQMHQFLPVQCTPEGVPANRVTRVPRCKHPQSCKTNFKYRNAEERYMSTCQPCPKFYPWIKNSSGE